MTLGQKIKLVRTERKLMQMELAEAAGIHQKNISKYENDGVVPSATNLKAIAKALGVTTDYLLGDEGEAPIRDTELLRSFQEVDQMPETFRGSLVDIIQAYVRDYKTRQAYSIN